MNLILGKILDVRSSGIFHSVLFEKDNVRFRILTLEFPGWAYPGKKLFAAFKETEVFLSTSTDMELSVENKFSCEVVSQKNGELFTQFVLDSSLGRIDAVVTRYVVESWEIRKGMGLSAYIPATSISLLKLEE